MTGIVELPNDEAAVALRYLQSSLGRDLELVSAVPVTAWPKIAELMGTVTLPTWTSPGDTPEGVIDGQREEARP